MLKWWKMFIFLYSAQCPRGWDGIVISQTRTQGFRNLVIILSRNRPWQSPVNLPFWQNTEDELWRIFIDCTAHEKLASRGIVAITDIIRLKAWTIKRKKKKKEDFIYWLLFQYTFHIRVIAVACKRSWSFCQKCRWQVTAKHTCALPMWLWVKWHCKLVHGYNYGVHRTCTEMAAVSRGTSHATSK